jgi:hypothetical protein
MINASATDCPPGKYASSVLPIGSSGPKVLSCASLGTILNVTSGASKFLPNEFAYFFNIISRTSSTKSSSCIVTNVAEAPGLFTQILRETMFADIVAGP